MRGALHIRALFAVALLHLNGLAASTDGGYWDSRFNPISGRPTVDVTADDNRRLLVWGQTLPVSIPLPGSVSIARWDGFKWEVLAKGAAPATVLARGDQVFAAGKFASISGVPAANIAVYQNGAWSSLAQGVNSNVTSIAFFGTNLIAGGNFTQAGSFQAPYIAMKWHKLGRHRLRADRFCCSRHNLGAVGLCSMDCWIEYDGFGMELSTRSSIGIFGFGMAINGRRSAAILMAI